MWWVSAGKKHCGWVCAACGEKCVWRAANRLTGGTDRCQCQSGKGVQSACVPQGLCENLINALELLSKKLEKLH